MKKINDTQRLQVLDAINELGLGISEFALEKANSAISWHAGQMRLDAI